MKWPGKREIPEKDPPTNGMIRHDSGVTRPGIEPGSSWWKASRLTAQSTWPPLIRPHNRTVLSNAGAETDAIPRTQNAPTREMTSLVRNILKLRRFDDVITAQLYLTKLIGSGLTEKFHTVTGALRRNASLHSHIYAVHGKVSTYEALHITAVQGYLSTFEINLRKPAQPQTGTLSVMSPVKLVTMKEKLLQGVYYEWSSSDTSEKAKNDENYEGAPDQKLMSCGLRKSLLLKKRFLPHLIPPHPLYTTPEVLIARYFLVGEAGGSDVSGALAGRKGIHSEQKGETVTVLTGAVTRDMSYSRVEWACPGRGMDALIMGWRIRPVGCLSRLQLNGHCVIFRRSLKFLAGEQGFRPCCRSLNLARLRPHAPTSLLRATREITILHASNQRLETISPSGGRTNHDCLTAWRSQRDSGPVPQLHPANQRINCVRRKHMSNIYSLSVNMGEQYGKFCGSTKSVNSNILMTYAAASQGCIAMANCDEGWELSMRCREGRRQLGTPSSAETEVEQSRHAARQLLARHRRVQHTVLEVSTKAGIAFPWAVQLAAADKPFYNWLFYCVMYLLTPFVFVPKCQEAMLLGITSAPFVTEGGIQMIANSNTLSMPEIHCAVSKQQKILISNVICWYRCACSVTAVEMKILVVKNLPYYRMCTILMVSTNNYCVGIDYRNNMQDDVAALVGGFSRGSPVSPTLALRRCSILTSFCSHWLSKTQCDKEKMALPLRRPVMQRKSDNEVKIHGQLLTSRRAVYMKGLYCYPQLVDVLVGRAGACPLQRAGRVALQRSSGRRAGSEVGVAAPLSAGCAAEEWDDADDRATGVVAVMGSRRSCAEQRAMSPPSATVRIEQRRNERAGETGDPEKTRQPTASSGTIPIYENPE
ncbi:hypothetical protein PR048_019880 [Dryococelus australis]|uniref:Uncharacterized protein n=1 Tax=Dryococelus australis TaxID=614101 RepID=A0ABQ9H4P4_9NEOP|nr:hypothetical protein PR048_019880 [Dryococelus australis]